MIENYKTPKVIAEIGCNHMGQMDIALELIKDAKQCGAHVAKFQKRNPVELLSEDEYNAPHPVPHNSYGNTYGEHREFLELDLDQHRELKTYSESIGITYATSVWDITSAKEIVSLNPELIKVPSACNNHFEMLKILRDDYGGQVHISTGMSTRKEIDDFVEFFEQTDAAKKRLIVYACTSGYPVEFSDVCLLEINRLRSSYGDRVASVGFSGHHLGIAIDIGAYTLGADWIERHFTKNRAWKGTDHSASLEAPGLGKLVRDLNATCASLTYKTEDVLDVEKVQRKKLKYNG